MVNGCVVFSVVELSMGFLCVFEFIPENYGAPFVCWFDDSVW